MEDREEARLWGPAKGGGVFGFGSEREWSGRMGASELRVGSLRLTIWRHYWYLSPFLLTTLCILEIQHAVSWKFLVRVTSCKAQLFVYWWNRCILLPLFTISLLAMWDSKGKRQRTLLCGLRRDLRPGWSWSCLVILTRVYSVSVHRYLLRVHHVPSPLLGTWDRVERKIDKSPCSCGTYILGGGERNNK